MTAAGVWQLGAAGPVRSAPSAASGPAVGQAAPCLAAGSGGLPAAPPLGALVKVMEAASHQTDWKAMMRQEATGGRHCAEGQPRGRVPAV